MEFGIEKCALLIMKSGKRHLTNGIETTKSRQESETRAEKRDLQIFRNLGGLTPSNKSK